MSCYHPLRAWRGRVGKSGKRQIVWKLNDADPALVKSELRLPCSQCIGCRLERSRQWAIRCVHEASLYDDNCFLTLTYNDDNLPSDGSLNTRDFQLFMKKLRKRYGSGIRFFQCGEYGELFSRPHHHALLFNFDFKDKYTWKCRNDIVTWRSPTLESLWPHGLSEIGSVTFESAAYVARYILKKVTGIDAVDHYVDHDNGVILKPEYVTMSRGSKILGTGGIGKAWFDKYKSDIYPHDYVWSRGIEMRPPKFYDKQYEILYPSQMRDIKNARAASAERLVNVYDRVLRKDVLLSDNRDERLEVKERVKMSKIKLLTRKMEAL